MRNLKKLSLCSRIDLRAAAHTLTTTPQMVSINSVWSSTGLSTRTESCKRNGATRKLNQPWINGPRLEGGWKQNSRGKKSIKMSRPSFRMLEASCEQIGNLRTLTRTTTRARMTHPLTIAMCCLKLKIRSTKLPPLLTTSLMSLRCLKRHLEDQQWPTK